MDLVKYYKEKVMKNPDSELNCEPEEHPDLMDKCFSMSDPGYAEVELHLTLQELAKENPIGAESISAEMNGEKISLQKLAKKYKISKSTACRHRSKAISWLRKNFYPL